MLLILLTASLMNFVEKIDQINVQCYDARADYWDRFPFPDRLPASFSKFYQPKLGIKVLDIGAGTGRVAAYFKDLGFDALCIDPSSEMIRRCRQLGLKTEQTTIQAYETDEVFGVAVAILSLIHVPKDQFIAEIRKIHRFLEPDGLFILSLLKGTTERIEEQTGGYPRFFARYTPQEVREKLDPYFAELDYDERGQYMLFIFRKKELIR